MSFLGLGKSAKSTQTTNQNFNQNSTENTNQNSNVAGSTRTWAPDWVSQGSQGLAGRVLNLAGVDPSVYVAGADPLQLKAAQGAEGLTGTPWNFDSALDLTRGVANASAPQTAFVSSSPFIKDFYDPYQNDVVNASAADLTANEGKVRAQQALDLAGAGAFGGSGAALTQSMTEGELARARASTLAGLRSAGFTQALGAAQNEAARKQAANDTNAGLMERNQGQTLSAAQQLANIASQFGGENRANVGAQLTAGGTLQDIASKQASAPLDLSSWAASLFPGLVGPYFGSDTTGTTSSTSNTTGTTTGSSSGTTTGKTTSKDPMGDIGKALQMVALFSGSDRRLKRNVIRLWKRRDGLWVYVFRYRPDRPLYRPGWHVGVMAQEVERVRPEAVARHDSGFLMVDYARI